MYKIFLGISLGFGLVFMPTLSYADEDKTASRAESLHRTAQRLTDLIKAAANQDLVNVNNKDVKKAVIKPNVGASGHSTQSAQSCSANDIFSFPPEARVEKYKDLLLLKKDMVIGFDQIDSAKAKTLALAYLGLGFGEEALITADMLQGHEKAAIRSMAKTLAGMAGQDEITYMRAQTLCNGSANIWLYALEDKPELLADQQMKLMVKQIIALPNKLQNILGQRLGIKAIQNDDLNTAKKIYKILLKLAPKHIDTRRPVLSTNMQFFKAALDVESMDADLMTAGLSRLKNFAKTEGQFQAYALQILSKHLPDGGNLYPGYILDLDTTAQTYSGQPKGKQAIAQKIIFKSQNHAFKEAIALTKSSFPAKSTYYEQSVLVISRQLHSSLQSNDNNVRIWALESLLDEKVFFATSNHANLLTEAAILASVDLGLPELAAHILPMDMWDQLDAGVVKILAVSLQQHMDWQEISAYFPKSIFGQVEFEIQKLNDALSKKNPGDAIEIGTRFPNNEIVQNAFITSAWNNGYWSIANNAINRKQLSSSGEGRGLPQVKQHLAATLSISSPALSVLNKTYDINELANLQSYIDTELAVFRAYLDVNNRSNNGGNNG